MIQAVVDLLRALFGAVVRPVDTLVGLAESERHALGVASVFLVGACWSAFSAALFLGGHQPTFVGNPIPAEHYYGWQAGFVLPLLLLSWAALGMLCHTGVGVFGGKGSLRSLFAALGPAYAAPALVLFLLPDVLVYVVGGFDALGPVFRVAAPLTALWMIVLCSLAVRVSHHVAMWKAVVVVLPAFALHGALAGSLLR